LKKAERRKRVISGVQPTGNLHLGNYLGAIRQWTELQHSYDSFFSIVDLHAITVPHDPKALKRDTLAAAAAYIACGVEPATAANPSGAVVFVQSHVKAHAELTWLLNCATPMTWLQRMIQYKEKARKQGENVAVGLFGYPVLMAADILLYWTDKVPVGEDQKQHLELARDIARRFNDAYGKKKRPVFKEPEPLILETGARIMSLLDGTAKMSKSDPAEGSRISLADPPEVIRRKIKRCKTDSFEGLEFGNPERPECQNLLAIYEIVSGKSREEVTREVADMSWGTFKPVLAEALVAHLEPIQVRYGELMQDKTYLHSVLSYGAERASEVAEKTLDNAKSAMGFTLPSDFE